MTAREQERARVLWRIGNGDLTVAQGAALLGLSERQVWRLRRVVAEAGPAGFVHGNRGRPSPFNIMASRATDRGRGESEADP